EVLPTLSIRELQQEVQFRSGIPAKQQLLSHAGVRLLAERSLQDFWDFGSLQLDVTSYAPLAQGPPTFLPCTEHRGIQLLQLQELQAYLVNRCRDGELRAWRDAGKPICLEALNLYQLADWVIRPATREDHCSYVELISSGKEAQNPQWFVSHAWQEPILDFVRCLQGHAEVRELEETVAYWVCAYANNQHELGDELRCNPRETSFFRAMQLSLGVVLVLDSEGTPFSRTWCCFELAMALTDLGESGESAPRHLHEGHARLLLDIATCAQGRAELLTDGLAPEEVQREESVCAGSGGKAKAKREESFPIELVQRALKIDIAEASASCPVDKIRILNSIAGLPPEQLDAPLGESPERRRRYEAVNRGLRAIFAMASVSQVVSKDLHELMPAICQALAEDETRRSLRLSFAKSLKFRDTDLVALVRALPALTGLLRLDLRSCHQLSDAAVLELAGALKRVKVTALFLDFFMCAGLTDLSIAQIFANSQHLTDMREFDLNVRGLVKVTAEVIPPLISALEVMPLLRKLHLNFCKTRQNDEAATVLIRTVKHLRHLEILRLYFTECSLVGSQAAAALGDSLSELRGLTEAILCFAHTGLTDAGLLGLCRGLGALQHCRRLTLRFHGCRELTDESLWVLGETLRGLSLQKLSLDLGKCAQLSKGLARRYGGPSAWELLQDPAFRRPRSAAHARILELFRERRGAFSNAEALYPVLKAVDPSLSAVDFHQLRAAALAEDAPGRRVFVVT
ncbi:unnamed protein product, partial [Effrenium voratum]